MTKYNTSVSTAIDPKTGWRMCLCQKGGGFSCKIKKGLAKTKFGNHWPSQWYLFTSSTSRFY